jgi:hypothetical protein
MFWIFSVILSKIWEVAEMLWSFTSFLFWLVSFLLVSGLFEMYFLWIYKYIMIWQEGEKLVEKEDENIEEIKIKEEIKEIEKVIEEKPKKSTKKVKEEEKVEEKPKKVRKVKDKE